MYQVLPAKYDVPALTVDSKKSKKQSNRLYTWIKNETVRSLRTNRLAAAAASGGVVEEDVAQDTM